MQALGGTDRRDHRLPSSNKYREIFGGLDRYGVDAVFKPESFPIEKIFVPEKRRKALKPEVVQEIAESILNIGQKDPIVVRREKDRFVLVEGLHRLEACKALGERAILGLLVSAEAARQKPLPSQDPGPELQNMERLRKLRLEKEAAQKLVGEQEHSKKTAPSNLKATPKQLRRERSESTPRTLSDWIKQQERDGGRY